MTKTRNYLKEKGREDKFKQILPDKDAYYERVINIDASQIDYTVSCPHTVDNTKLATELSDIKVDQVYVGTCTNGRIEDLRIVGNILKGNKVNDDVRMLICPCIKRCFI
jgi:3-isopropylmalate/(R)-2-methylmalate dehydratase large subunit